MNRIYSTGNKSHMHAWIIAADEDEAKKVAVSVGHVRHVDNLNIRRDETDQHLAAGNGSEESLKEILLSGWKGQVALNIPVRPMTDLIEFAKTGIKVESDPSRTTWVRCRQANI